MVEERKRIKVTDAAKILCVNRQTILHWIQSGKLRAFRAGVGCMWLIDSDDLENLLKPNIPLELESEGIDEKRTRPT